MFTGARVAAMNSITLRDLLRVNMSYRADNVVKSQISEDVETITRCRSVIIWARVSSRIKLPVRAGLADYIDNEEG